MARRQSPENAAKNYIEQLKQYEKLAGIRDQALKDRLPDVARGIEETHMRPIKERLYQTNPDWFDSFEKKIPQRDSPRKVTTVAEEKRSPIDGKAVREYFREIFPGLYQGGAKVYIEEITATVIKKYPDLTEQQMRDALRLMKESGELESVREGRRTRYQPGKKWKGKGVETEVSEERVTEGGKLPKDAEVARTVQTAKPPNGGNGGPTLEECFKMLSEYQDYGLQIERMATNGGFNETTAKETLGKMSGLLQSIPTGMRSKAKPIDHYELIVQQAAAPKPVQAVTTQVPFNAEEVIKTLTPEDIRVLQMMREAIDMGDNKWGVMRVHLEEQFRKEGRNFKGKHLNRYIDKFLDKGLLVRSKDGIFSVRY